ncbi:RNA polymerase sigma factor [Mariniblastus fucicola]|uniref:RNA polymerase sigma factor YlaC n=1 Tax=Mariniblastus fucicola TaxID=980251 RepID=A0A5B9P317_9BACT|nr:sigma-70 family RNA polymerase sigma factor [Mariniblastus fucicola]QEG20554.1 RNA polymerase sigma factor YlaC [Mariniblastus fucicola]
MEDSATPAWIDAAIEQYEAPLLRYAQHFVFDLESARDVVQDTFLKLCKQSENEMRPKLAKWLFTVCRNRAIDVCRKESRMKVAPEDQISDQLVARADDSMNPMLAIEKVETAEGLLQHVSRLPDQQQEVLRLKFQGGLTYREIAEVTGLSSSHIGVILHTAITKLRQRMVPE